MDKSAVLKEIQQAAFEDELEKMAISEKDKKIRNTAMTMSRVGAASGLLGPLVLWKPLGALEQRLAVPSYNLPVSQSKLLLENINPENVADIKPVSGKLHGGYQDYIKKLEKTPFGKETSIKINPPTSNMRKFLHKYVKSLRNPFSSAPILTSLALGTIPALSYYAIAKKMKDKKNRSAS